MTISEESTVLSSWKDIAKYLGKGVRTVQRWERHLGLPVRRPNGAVQKSAVVVYRGDVDAWLATHFSARTLEKQEARTSQSARCERSTLRENIRKARQLRDANLALTKQIADTISELNARCQRLSSQSKPDIYLADDFKVEKSTAAELGVMPELLPTESPFASERIA